MNALRVTPLVISALLLGAHFYRSGGLVPAVLVASSPLLLLVSRPWGVTVLQVGLFVAAAEWVRTASTIAAFREAAGMPATRMLVVLGAVALFSALSAIPLNRLRRT